MEVGKLIRESRERVQMSLRELSGRAGISPSSLSMIEHGRNSPTLATLQKLLKALGTDFAEFFANADTFEKEPVFRCADMRVIKDAYRQYTLLFPKRDDLKFEMVRETISHREPEGEWEVHDFDIGGVVLQGGPLRLEIEGVGEWEIRAGDALYIEAGRKHRASNAGDRPSELVTVAYPAKY